MSALLDAHLARLDATLFGPAAARGRLLDEARAGLLDACAAYEAAGYPPPDAAELAVRDFGTVPAVRPAYQAELFAVQARRTAVVLAVKAPMIVAMWWGCGSVNPYPQWQFLPAGVRAATMTLGMLACGVALFGLAAATGRTGRRFGPALVVPATVVGTAALLSGVLMYAVMAYRAMCWPPMAPVAVLTALLAASLVLSARRCRLAAVRLPFIP